MPSSPTVLIGEDEPAIVECLVSHLRTVDWSVVGIARSPLHCLELTRALRPAATVLSFELLSVSRAYPARLVGELNRVSRVILLLDSRNLADAIEALALARGFIFRDINLELTTLALDMAMQGYCFLPQQVLPLILSDRVRLDLLASLTPQEHRVLILLGQGLSNRQIAHLLTLPLNSVGSLVRSALSKLHFENRTQAGVFAVWHRLSGQKNGGPIE